MEKFRFDKTAIFEILSKTISEGMVIINEDQVIVASNEATDTIFGYDRNELIGKNLNILIPPKYRKMHPRKVREFMQKKQSRLMGHGEDIFGIKKNNVTFPLEAGLNPFQIGKDQYTLALITDISLRKKQEQEILRLNSKLNQLVNERTEELRKIIRDLRKEISKRKKAESQIKEALQKERELGELRTKFLSLVSHEFKTPLSVILSSATLAGKYTTTEQQEKREKHIKTIKLQIKTLNNILNDFLSIERLNTGKDTYKRKVFPLSRLINHVIYDANMLSKEGQIINYPNNIDNITLYFDEEILKQALTNLINNAIKYSPENSVIDIEVTEQEENLNIHVRDQGIGIPEKEQKFIFDPYFRAENALLQKGTGIGLNIVKGHLENLNSTISFKSKESEGSTFSISLPFLKNENG